MLEIFYELKSSRRLFLAVDSVSVMEIGVKGWVRNLYNERVEILAIGEINVWTHPIWSRYH